MKLHVLTTSLSFRFLQKCKVCAEGIAHTLTTQEVVDMALQIVHGMQYIHRKKILHKDVAARNCVYAIKHYLKPPEIPAACRWNSFQFLFFLSEWTTSWEFKYATMLYPETCSLVTTTVWATTRTGLLSGFPLKVSRIKLSRRRVMWLVLNFWKFIQPPPPSPHSFLWFYFDSVSFSGRLEFFYGS